MWRSTARRTLPVGLLILGACASASHIAVLQPATPPPDLSAYRRIWIAGFLTNEVEDIDVNVETVRLLRRRLSSNVPVRVINAAPLIIADEAALKDAERWEKLGEEYGAPLIVTGSVRLVKAPPVPVQSASIHRSNFGLRQGFVLKTTFVFIDGRTGTVIASQRLPDQKLYAADQRASTMSLYFQLMDRVVPTFLRSF
jgi:hypothetical protein